MIRTPLRCLALLLLITSFVSQAFGLPAEDVQPVFDNQYVQVAQKMMQEAKKTIHVMMFEMAYYPEHPGSPSNQLIKELIHASQRGVKVEVILEVREGEDRTTKRNRQTGKILSDGGVKVIYDDLAKTNHAKWMVVDTEFTLLGSTNWTYYALTGNNEVSVKIKSKEVAKALLDYFNRVKTASSESQKKD